MMMHLNFWKLRKLSCERSVTFFYLISQALMGVGMQSQKGFLLIISLSSLLENCRYGPTILFPRKQPSPLPSPLLVTLEVWLHCRKVENSSTMYVYVASHIDLQPSKKLNFFFLGQWRSIHNAHQYNSHGHFWEVSWHFRSLRLPFSFNHFMLLSVIRLTFFLVNNSVMTRFCRDKDFFKASKNNDHSVLGSLPKVTTHLFFSKGFLIGSADDQSGEKQLSIDMDGLKNNIPHLAHALEKEELRKIIQYLNFKNPDL